MNRFLDFINSLIRGILEYYIHYRKFKNVRIGKNAYVELNCQMGNSISIGGGCIIESTEIDDYSYVNYNSIIKSASIGKFCSIGPNVVIGLGNHPTSMFVSTSPRFYLKEHFAEKDFFDQFTKVKIGNDVWIGANTTIINGITIGDGAIIGANTLVNKNVEPYTIVGGVPARKLKKRFQNEEIDFLLKFKWWDKDINWIKNNYKLFHSIKIMRNEFPRI